MPKTYELELEDYWRIIKRRKVIVIGTFVVITSAFFVQSSRTPPTFEATAAIKVERSIAVSEVQVDWDTDFIETQMQVIVSRGVAYEAAIVAGRIKPGMPQEEIEGAVEGFRNTKNKRRGRTNIVDIATTANDPEEAALIVNSVARGYQTWSLKDHNEQARKVREFVEQQLKEADEGLKGKEQELREFKENSPIGASVASFQSQLVEFELKLSNLLEKYTYRHPEVVELQAQIMALKTKLGKYPELELIFNQLTRDVENLRIIQSGLKQKYEEARTAEAQNVSGVSLLNVATVPEDPISPDIPRSTSLGGVIGLILGVLLAFVKENVDTSISTIEEVEDFLQVPILGVIPEMIRPDDEGIKWWERLRRLIPAIGSFRRSAGSDTTDIEEVRKMIMMGGIEHHFSPQEAYKTLRTNVLFAVGEKKGVVLEITSSGAREGKSLTALNMSLTLAQGGNKTCLITADLRRESICRVLGINKEPGLVDVLTKDVPWKDVLRKTTDFLVGKLPPDRILQTPGIDNFYVLTSGRLPMNPAELLALPKMETLLQELRAEFDFVIVDMPPTLPVSDPSIIAPKADAVILVYQVGRTARGALKRTKVQIASTGAKILGVVLNNIKAAEMRMAPSYYYYYEYYGPDEELVRERRKQKRAEKSWWRKFLPKRAA